MNLSIFSKLALRLSTMHGYPGWSEAMSENYFADLGDLPDAVTQQMIAGVGKCFDERPSAKNLREWARSLGPQKPFDIRQLSAPKPAAHRPGSSQLSARAGLTSAVAVTEKIAAEKAGIPDSVKAVFRQIKERDRADRRGVVISSPQTGDWGLEYIYPGGKTERYPARFSEELAQQKAREITSKYSHLQCRVWHKAS